MKSRRFWPAAAIALSCLASLALARSPVGGPAEKLAELREKRDTAQAEWMEKLQAATSQEEGLKIWKARPGREFIAGFKEVATEAKGTDTAREAWFEVLATAADLGEKKDAQLAIDTTLVEHIASPDLGAFAGVLGEASGLIGADSARKAFETLIEKSEYPAVLAPALFGLGTMSIESGSDDQKATGRKALERLVSEFPTVKPKRGSPYADRAKGYLFELDHLQIGMVAPNFESIDENGATFSIADYKGKVVVLDFWGNW